MKTSANTTCNSLPDRDRRARTMTWPTPITLRDIHASLLPLATEHHDGLVAAASEGELWKLWYTIVTPPEKMRGEIDRRLRLQEQGSMLPFTIVDNENDRIVGMTTYMNIDAANRRLEIGSTWYARSVQRTAINTECKRLLLAPRIRAARLYRGRIAYESFQSAEPTRDRASRREARWHPAQSHASSERHAARHLRLQHHRRRVAGGEGESQLAAGTATQPHSQSRTSGARYLISITARPCRGSVTLSE